MNDREVSTALPRPLRAAEDRLHLSSGLHRQLNKVFPAHWSFLLGEVALYSFVVLLATGTYLALFFDPSMEKLTYHGSYVPNVVLGAWLTVAPFVLGYGAERDAVTNDIVAGVVVLVSAAAATALSGHERAAARRRVDAGRVTGR